MGAMTERIFTVGHSTHPIDEFVRLLKAHSVEQIVDVRTIPKSRHNPQFGEDQLRTSLPENGIGYRRLESLGGLRHTTKESANGAWKNASFRGYADYMQTDAFAAGLNELLTLAADKVSAIMCAEAVPWRCRRSPVTHQAGHPLSPQLVLDLSRSTSGLRAEMVPTMAAAIALLLFAVCAPPSSARRCPMSTIVILMSPPPPRPCSARKTMSSGIVAARPHRSEPTMYAVSVMSMTERTPIASASLP